MVRRAPPSTATRSAAASLMAAAALDSATPHGTADRLSPWRTRGAPRRSSLLTDSKPKRPLSHNQPQLTGSMSTPWYRRISLRLDCTTMRQPVAQPEQVLSTWSRSQGRALKRYGDAVRAPTGQICTVLPAEVAGEGVVREGVDLRLAAAVLEVDQRVAGDVLGEAGAPVAEDAALAVEGHEVADRDRLLEVPLLLDEPALARAVGHRLVLEGALAALVADRAVERVVHEQELEDAVLGLLRGLALGLHDHVGRHRDHAGRLERRATARVDVDDAHAAHAHRLHARVVAEARDVGAGALGGLDHELAGHGLDRRAVDREDHRVRGSAGSVFTVSDTGDLAGRGLWAWEACRPCR